MLLNIYLQWNQIQEPAEAVQHLPFILQYILRMWCAAVWDLATQLAAKQIAGPQSRHSDD